MKSKTETVEFAAWLKSLVAETFPREKPSDEDKGVIFLRLTATEKKAIDAAAKSVGLTTTEYLLRCHQLISAKLPKT